MPWCSCPSWCPAFSPSSRNTPVDPPNAGTPANPRTPANRAAHGGLSASLSLVRPGAAERPPPPSALSSINEGGSTSAREVTNRHFRSLVLAQPHASSAGIPLAEADIPGPSLPPSIPSPSMQVSGSEDGKGASGNESGHRKGFVRVLFGQNSAQGRTDVATSSPEGRENCSGPDMSRDAISSSESRQVANVDAITGSVPPDDFDERNPGLVMRIRVRTVQQTRQFGLSISTLEKTGDRSST
jgi:hypothetical protein